MSLKETGLQSKAWDGYFDEGADSVMGSWIRCMVCKKIPCEIYVNSHKFFNVCHCKSCKEEDYTPKNWWEKFWMWMDCKKPIPLERVEIKDV